MNLVGGDARAEWRAHWPVVLAACSGVAISTINTYSLGVFMQPLQHEFGWSRAGIASGQLIAGVTTVVLAPLMVWRLAVRVRAGAFAELLTRRPSSREVHR